LHETVILAIDAAWTASEPSGVALVSGQGNRWRCLCVAPSYDAFLSSSGAPIDWGASRFRGTAPSAAALVEAARLIAGINVSLVTVDMPVAAVPFVTRRMADNAVSSTFGGRGCSAHSPNERRPGELGSKLMEELSGVGFPLATASEAAGTLGRTIEVYPHPALLCLLQSSYRVPYKIAKSRRYWPTADLRERITRLLAQLNAMNCALREALGDTCVQLPPPDEIRRLAQLKRYEDAIDALVCAWVGTQYVNQAATPYGDSTAAIWIPGK